MEKTSVEAESLTMQNVMRGRFRFFYAVLVCSLIGYAGCRKSSDRLEGTPLPEVLLRYTPQVGLTYDYGFLINLDKKIFLQGKWRTEGNEKVEGVISIETTEQNGDTYSTTFGIRMGKSNLSKETMEVMRDKVKAAESYELKISDRYVCDNVDNWHNLCFPDESVSPGTEWTGEMLFSFGDMATVNAPTLKMSYRLIKAVENKDGKYCLIECKPLTTRVEIPLQIGQLGLKCDAIGKVTAVREDSDAQGKIEVGDVLTAVNGLKTVSPRDWHVMYERFIEMPNNVGSSVLLTIKRNGQEQDVSVLKSFVTLGTMEVTISKPSQKVVFDIDKGILVSDESSSEYSVMYYFLDEFPFVDDYMGSSSFKGRAKAKMGPRIYYNQWRMKLIQ